MPPVTGVSKEGRGQTPGRRSASFHGLSPGEGLRCCRGTGLSLCTTDLLGAFACKALFGHWYPNGPISQMRTPWHMEFQRLDQGIWPVLFPCLEGLHFLQPPWTEHVMGLPDLGTGVCPQARTTMCLLQGGA